MEWISAESRLPSVTVNETVSNGVLMASQEGGLFIGMMDYKRNSWVWLNMNRVPHTVTITHWMPLPDPPEVE